MEKNKKGKKNLSNLSVTELKSKQIRSFHEFLKTRQSSAFTEEKVNKFEWWISPSTNLHELPDAGHTKSRGLSLS